MIADDELLAIGDSALASLAHGEAEVVIADSRSELTRFARGSIISSVVAGAWMGLSAREKRIPRIPPRASAFNSASVMVG